MVHDCFLLLWSKRFAAPVEWFHLAIVRQACLGRFFNLQDIARSGVLVLTAREPVNESRLWRRFLLILDTRVGTEFAQVIRVERVWRVINRGRLADLIENIGVRAGLDRLIAIKCQLISPELVRLLIVSDIFRAQCRRGRLTMLARRRMIILGNNLADRCEDFLHRRFFVCLLGHGDPRAA